MAQKLQRIKRTRSIHRRCKTKVDGAFLIEQVVEEAPGVPISLGGCYQRCLITQGNPSGCKSYAYYPPHLHPHSQDLEARGENHRPQEQEEYSSEEGHEQDGQGRPHCDLFGEEVAAIFSPGLQLHLLLNQYQCTIPGSTSSVGVRWMRSGLVLGV